MTSRACSGVGFALWVCVSSYKGVCVRGRVVASIDMSVADISAFVLDLKA